MALGVLTLAASMHGQSGPMPGNTPLPALPIGFELGGSVLTDAWMAAATPPPALVAPVSPDVTRMEPFVIHAPPPEKDVVRPTESPLDRFFRTGILESIELRRATLKLTVGPCEGGQLLNVKSIW
jgi:hypothetical protein